MRRWLLWLLETPFRSNWNAWNYPRCREEVGLFKRPRHPPIPLQPVEALDSPEHWELEEARLLVPGAPWGESGPPTQMGQGEQSSLRSLTWAKPAIWVVRKNTWQWPSHVVWTCLWRHLLEAQRWGSSLFATAFSKAMGHRVDHADRCGIQGVHVHKTKVISCQTPLVSHFRLSPLTFSSSRRSIYLVSWVSSSIPFKDWKTDTTVLSLTFWLPNGRNVSHAFPEFTSPSHLSQQGRRHLPFLLKVLLCLLFVSFPFLTFSHFFLVLSSCFHFFFVSFLSSFFLPHISNSKCESMIPGWPCALLRNTGFTYTSKIERQWVSEWEDVGAFKVPCLVLSAPCAYAWAGPQGTVEQKHWGMGAGERGVIGHYLRSLKCRAKRVAPGLGGTIRERR